MFIQFSAGMRSCMASACACLLASCATYVSRPIDPAAQNQRFEARSLSSAEVRQTIERQLERPVASWPPAAWDFPKLVTVAESYNPEVAVASAGRRTAEASLIAAGQRPNPNASALVENNRDAIAGTSPWIYGFSLDWPFETAGKRGYRIEQSQQLINAAAWREADVRWQVRSQVRSGLLDAYPSVATVIQQLSIQEELVAAMNKRFAAGFIARPDLTQAQLALNQTRLSVTEVRKREDEGRVHLATAIGLSNTAFEGTALDFSTFNTLPSMDQIPPAESRRQALLNRPDVLAALANYEASQAALQLEIAKQYPDVSIGPGYTWDQGDVKWSLGLSLTLPLLNRNQGGIAVAEAKREELAATFQTVQAKAIGEVDEALAGYRHALQAYETAKDIQLNQEASERAAATAFAAGQIDRVEWLSAKYLAIAASKSRIDALIQAQRALGRLEDSLRRPTSTEQNRVPS